jgi:hypothetical protein
MPFRLLAAAAAVVDAVAARSRLKHSHGTGAPSSENPFIVLTFSINSLVCQVFQNN